MENIYLIFGPAGDTHVGGEAPRRRSSMPGGRASSMRELLVTEVISSSTGDIFLLGDSGTPGILLTDSREGCLRTGATGGPPSVATNTKLDVSTLDGLKL